MEVYTLFEFLSIHFQIIHFQNKKKKFVKWFSSVFTNDSITQKSPNFFYRDESTKTIVVNITTPEWSIFGDRFQTQKNRERYLKKLGITKLISMIAFIILLFLTTRAFNQGSIILSIILLLLCLSLFIAGIGIPKKYSFSSLATVASAITCFLSDDQCSIYFVETENQLYSDLPSFIKTETIWIFDDLYNGDILTCKSKKIDDRTCNYLQSIKKDNQEIYLINKQRDKTTVPPKKLISSFREINNEITKF